MVYRYYFFTLVLIKSNSATSIKYTPVTLKSVYIIVLGANIRVIPNTIDMIPVTKYGINFNSKYLVNNPVDTINNSNDTNDGNNSVNKKLPYL